jgi:FecR protein
MKQIQSLIRGLLAGCFALAMVTTLAAQTQEGIVKVVNLKGAARYMTGGTSNWKPIKVGITLKPGTVIQTAADSYVDVVLNNAKATQGLGSALSSEAYASSTSTASTGGGNYKPKVVQDAIRIFENTVLGVDKLTVMKTGADTVTETQLDLKAGRIFGTVKKLSATSVYEIKIPNGVAGIRGTIYLIGADGVLSVLTGSVVISYVFNGALITKEVPAGYQFNPATGLVTPITDPILKELARLAQIFSMYLPVTPAVIYTQHDNTIYNVSPTQGGTGGGGNNNPAP